ncbi:hypothetical protein FBZ98_12117 [Rhizobium sp. ERR 922]|nr:hypothetical protein FBZ98_12117 [Rhizobium sp. ERR 922]TWB87380.1 hypothetical protein FBZ97_1201 [Rhizobium sp. ERR 942]
MWLAGLVSFGSPQRSHVAVDNDFKLSPWVTAGDIATKGTLHMSDTKVSVSIKRVLVSIFAVFAGVRLQGQRAFA